MTVSHHLTDETLQDYTAGTLSMSMETLVACHLTVCHRCRRRADMGDSIGGSCIETADSVAVNSSFDDVMARIRDSGEQGSAAANQATATHSEHVSGVPRPLGRLLPGQLEQLDWKRIAPGIKQHNLTDQHRRHGAFKLLHLAPGVVLSAHSHNDRELTYVVRGSYQDELGRFKAGDIADLDGHDVHQPVVDTAEPCIALIATHSPVRFTGVMGKIMQPFVGI